MLGRIRWGEERGARLEREELLGLSLLTLTLPRRARRRERPLKKGARALAQGRVTRVLAPPGFSHWPLLLEGGLRPVDTLPLRCALAPAWVRRALAERGVVPERAVVRLTGDRESPDMARVAMELCPMVRNLVIDVPGGGALAARLRREFGLPVLPAQWAGADLTLPFNPGPALEGARFSLEGVRLPADCEVLSLLGALWECGRIRREDIAISI